MALKREKVIRAAEKYVSRGKLEAAIKEYRKVLAENPNDANTLNRVGDLYARIEKFGEAVRLFSQIAEQYTRDGFFVKAIAIYKKIIKLDPSALAVYERLAELYHKQGLLNEARTQYQVLADYFQKHDNATSAITIYQKMSQMEPENPSFHLKLAELYTSQRLSEKALKEYRQLADILIVNGSVDEASQVYLTAFEAFPEELDFIGEAVSGLRENDHVGSAAKVLARAVELNPEAARFETREVSPEPSEAVEPAESGATPGETSGAADDDVFSAPDTTFDIDTDSLESSGWGASGFVPEDTRAPSFGGGAETSFADAEESPGGSAVESAPSFESDDPNEETFTFDLFDDEIPDSQVTPPADMLESPPTGETGEFELDLDLEESAFGELSFGDEEPEVSPAADSATAEPSLGDVATEPTLPQTEPAEPVEIDWSIDDMGDLDLEVAESDEPVEVSTGDLVGESTEPTFEIDSEELEPFEPGASGVLDDLTPDLSGLEDIRFDDDEATAGHEPVAVVPEADEVEEIELGDLTIDAGRAVSSFEEAAPEAVRFESLEKEAATLVSASVEEVDVDLALEPETLAEPELVAESEELPAPAEAEAAAEPSIETATSETAAPEPPVEATAEDSDIGIDEVDLDSSLPDITLPEPSSAPESATAVAQREGGSPTAVRKEEDLLAEARVFAKYGLAEKAKDRLEDLLQLSPENLEALQLEMRLNLEGGRSAEVIRGASEIRRLAVESGELEPWEQVEAELAKAGFRLDGDRVVHQPAKKLPGDDRIAQLLEDLSLDELASSPESAPAEVAEASVGDDSTVATVGATEAPEPEPEAPVAESPAESESARPPSAGKKLISLVDELGLDELDDELEFDEASDEPVAAAASEPQAPAAASSPLDPLDETGMSWLEDVETDSDGREAAVETIFDEEDDFFDLAAELERELSEDELADDDGIVHPQEQSLEEIIEGFKQGVADNLSPEDYDTHFNLGIAYREMGLLDEAIGEFQLASKDERYLVDCSSLLGLCFLDKGLPELAIRWYRKGLEAPTIAEEATMGLLYEMGNAYATLGDSDAAYKTFVEIYGLNSNYRDVSSRLEELREG